MAASTVSQVEEDTRFILTILLQEEHFTFEKLQETATKPSQHHSAGKTTQSQENLVRNEITELPYTKTQSSILYAPSPVDTPSRDEILDQIAQRIKQQGDTFNEEITQQLQELILERLILVSTDVAYSTFETWVMEILTRHQYSLSDKNDKYKVSLILFSVKTIMKTAKGKVTLASSACSRLFNYTVDFVCRRFPNWLD